MEKIGGTKSIKYDEGYGVFSPFARRDGNGDMYEVTIAYTGDRGKDFTAAKKALMKDYGLTSQEARKIIKNQTWHHTENVYVDAAGQFQGTTILVNKKIHNTFRHTGGFEIYKNWLQNGDIVW